MSNIRANATYGNLVRFNIDKVKVIKTASGKILFAGTHPIQEPNLSIGTHADSSVSAGYYVWTGSVYITFPYHDNISSEFSRCFAGNIPYEFKFINVGGDTPSRNTNAVRYDMRNVITNATATTYLTYGALIDGMSDPDYLIPYNNGVYINVDRPVSVPWDNRLGTDRNEVSITTTFLIRPYLTYDVTDFYASNGGFWKLSDYNEGGIIVDDDIYDGVIVGSDIYD